LKTAKVAAYSGWETSQLNLSSTPFTKSTTATGAASVRFPVEDIGCDRNTPNSMHAKSLQIGFRETEFLKRSVAVLT
jgi:hypothetical protein